MRRTLAFFISAVFATTLGTACAKKSMSDRDVRREQLRINAHKKRLELEPLAGNFRGHLVDATGYKQDVSLHLELKDVPETEGGEVDPVLVPTVNGALSLTYGSGKDVELFSFGTSRADFNAADSRLDLIVANTEFKEINLSLVLAQDKLSGTWSSPSTALSGTVELVKTPELYLGGDTPALKGAYPGLLEWADEPFFARGTLSFVTAQDGVDSFHVSASLRIVLASAHASETFIYEYETVEFNPLTRQVTVRSEESDLYLIGQLTREGITGEWHSKRTGMIGPMTFRQGLDGVPDGKQESPTASGNWYAGVTNLRPDSQLPERLLLGFNAVPRPGVIGGMELVGSARFYYGPFTTTEYVEYRFETIDYQPFSRRVVAVTAGTPKLTVQMDMSAGTVAGRITDSTLGFVATFRGERQAKPQTGPSLAGSYDGYFLYEGIKAYQSGQIHLVPSTGSGELKLAASLTLGYGGLGSGEALTYRFDETEFNAVTGQLNLANEASDVVVKAHVENQRITGEWFSTAMGKLGRFELAKASPVLAPADHVRLEKIKGTYRGALVNTHPDTNLPERIMFGLITTLDPTAPRGLKVTGNLRLYYGSFDSTEFVELPFETLQLDPFRRTFAGKTGGALRLTVQGTLSTQSRITGTLSDDSLGQVGTFEVNRHDP